MNNSLTIKIRKIIAEHFGIDPNRLTDESRFRDDLRADWLDCLELMIAIEDQIVGIEIDDVVVDHIDTVGDLMRVVESCYKKKATAGRPGGQQRVGAS